MNRKFFAALGLVAATLSPSAHAGVVYSEGFTAGTFSPWTQGGSYWSNCAGQGNCVLPSGGQSGAYLRLGTATGPTGRDSQPDHRFFISTPIAVNAGGTYTLSFFLQDDYYQSGGQPYTVPVMAQINGVQVGGIVKAQNSGWNEINLTWQSGSATTATISLFNEYQLSTYWQSTSSSSRDWGFGNDFALDTVALSCSTACGTAQSDVPEPTSLALAGAALMGLVLARRSRA